MLKITIPTPCHEDWETMTTNENGRDCAACCKTVVDFTAMTDDELCKYFLLKKEEKICGIFKNKQLHHTEVALPQNIFSLQMPWWKSFLVASLIVFGSTLFSCNTSIKEELNKEETTTGVIVVNPTVTPPDRTVGMIDIKHMPKQYPDTFCTVTKGEVEILPAKPEQLIVGKPFTIMSPDTSNKNISDQELKRDTPLVLPNETHLSPDSSFIKNPPKADSTKCDAVPIIYSQASIKKVPRSTTSPSPGL